MRQFPSLASSSNIIHFKEDISEKAQALIQ